MSSYKLRPHHGLCIGFFAGKGYSAAFVQHMTEQIALLKAQNPLLKLVVETDCICTACPHNQDGLCDSAEKVQRYDRAVLQLCDLPEGAELSYSSFQETVKARILHPGLLGDVCADCQWYGICGSAVRTT